MLYSNTEMHLQQELDNLDAAIDKLNKRVKVLEAKNKPFIPPTITDVNVYIDKLNATLTHQYAFEGNATTETTRDQQVAMLDIEIGDWVVKGEQIGRFLTPVALDHVHFAVYIGDAICPRLVMGQTDYDEIMTLVHSFHPTWELCYLP